MAMQKQSSNSGACQNHLKDMHKHCMHLQPCFNVSSTLYYHHCQRRSVCNTGCASERTSNMKSKKEALSKQRTFKLSRNRSTPYLLRRQNHTLKHLNPKSNAREAFIHTLRTLCRWALQPERTVLQETSMPDALGNRCSSLPSNPFFVLFATRPGCHQGLIYSHPQHQQQQV
jgi:hypothetical protein